MTLSYSYKILGLTLSLILFAGSSGTAFAENDWTEEQLETGQYSIADPSGQGVGAHIDPDNRVQYHIDQITNLASFEVATAVTPLEGCSCVVFRMDDVQDFFVSAVQVAIMDEFTSRGEFLSIGPIQNFFGADDTVLIPAQTGETSGLFEVFNHGWNHTDFTADNLFNQTSDMGLAQAKAITQFGEAPNVFIPPFNAWNADTITAMDSNGLTILSSQVSLETTPGDIFQADGSIPHTVDGSGIYHLPVEAFVLDTNPEPDERRNPTEILTAIDSSIADRGYAVLLFHPQEFADGAVVNGTAFAELQAVIDGVNAKNYPIRTFNQVVAFNGTVSIGNVTQVEGNSGTSDFVFDVTRSDTTGAMSVDYTVVDGTATVGDSDYNTIPDGTLAFTDGGVLTKTITVPVVGDSTEEPDETFNVNLSNCVGCTIVNGLGPVTTGVGVGTITQDDVDVSIDDVVLLEGNSGTTSFVFNVTRTNNLGTTSVDYTTADNSATQPSDYTTTSGTLVIPNGGPLIDTITVPVVGDNTEEPHELFAVNLSNCVACNIADAQGIGTITNDDGDISIDDVALAEGNSGTTDFVFTVTRSNNAGAMSVDYTTADNSATQPSDYTTTSGTLNFANGGPLIDTITVSVVGDSIEEQHELFNVNLSNCVGCSITVPQGIGTITNDDADVSINDVALAEGDSGTTDFVFTVTRSNNISEMSVDYTTANNSATQPSDYTTTSGTLNFANGGPLTDTITVPVVGDTPIESDEIFNVNLSNCVGCSITVPQGAGTILNDDTVGPQEQDLGSPGIGPGQFNSPSDVAVDSNNRIIVADANNDRIQIFNSVGTFLSEFGSTGFQNGQFNNPTDVAVDSNNRIIVADTNNDRIQIFGSDGTYQSKFGTTGSGNTQFNGPVGLAIGSANKIIVADTNNDRIQIFNSAGTYQSQFGSSGPGNGQFSFPSGVGVDSTNRIIVADSNNHRIQIFNSAGTYQSQFGTPGSGNTQFSNPSDVEIKSADRILVADTFNHRIQIFDSTGSHIQSFGSQGSDDGEFQNPSGVVVDSTERVIVADTNNNRIQIFQANTLGDDLDSDGIPDSTDTENIINTSTLLTGSHTVANVTVQNGAVLTIPNGFTLMITPGNNLTIESGSGVLVKSGGTLQINQ